MLPPTFTEESQPQLLWNTHITLILTFTGLSPSKVLRSRRVQLRIRVTNVSVLTTHPTLHHCRGFVLPCSAFTHRYSRNRICFLFLRLLRCFNSARSSTFRCDLKQVRFAFRNPRINVRMQLPAAYRSLPRPSSALKPSYPLSGFFPALRRRNSYARPTKANN